MVELRLVNEKLDEGFTSVNAKLDKVVERLDALVRLMQPVADEALLAQVERQSTPSGGGYPTGR